MSARSVSVCRSRSNVRPSASVPANAMAIHRIPAAASSSGWPSLTSANAKTSTQDTAKNAVVYRTSRLLTSTVRSLRITSHATRKNIWLVPRLPALPQMRPVALPQVCWTRLVGNHAPFLEHDGSIDQPLGNIKVVGRQHDQPARFPNPFQPLDERCHRRVVEPCE